MADLTKTFTVQLGMVGAGQPQYWGTLVWGTNEWGSESLYLTTAKGIANSLDISSTVGKYVTKIILNDLTLDSAVGKSSVKVVANNMTVSSAMESIYRLNGAYYYVWPGGVTNFLDRSVVSYSAVSAAASGWTAATQPSTTWSAV